ncbi:hypothetical protein HOC14_00325 [bacterium]|jgi:hypothetical protein|nr:hypothetical protein [bacterium]
MPTTNQGLIYVDVRVDRNKTPQQLFKSIGREQQCISDAVIGSIPRGEGEFVRVAFLEVVGRCSEDELEGVLNEHGLIHDPYAQIQVNINDPNFADDHPNGVHWKDVGHWCYASFYNKNGEHRIAADRSKEGVPGGYWVGGVPK